MLGCPLKDESYKGNCQFCNLKVECMLQDALKKLEHLEAALAEKKAEPVHQYR